MLSPELAQTVLAVAGVSIGAVIGLLAVYAKAASLFDAKTTATIDDAGLQQLYLEDHKESIPYPRSAYFALTASLLYVLVVLLSLLWAPLPFQWIPMLAGIAGGIALIYLVYLLARLSRTRRSPRDNADSMALRDTWIERRGKSGLLRRIWLSPSGSSGRVDVFVCHAAIDRPWGEWIAWQLKDAGYRTLVWSWNYKPGDDFIRAMEGSAIPIVVLSNYFRSELPSALSSSDSLVGKATLESSYFVQVRVEPVRPVKRSRSKLVDLVGVSREEAKERLLSGVRQLRRNSTGRPRSKDNEPVFPGSLADP